MINTLSRYQCGLVAALLLASSIPGQAAEDRGHFVEGMPTGSGSYDELVELWDEFLSWRNAFSLKEFHDTLGTE